MAFKWVVYKGKLKFGNVELHKNLLPPNYQNSDVAGGGLYSVDKSKKQIKLFGESFDFGQCSFEEVRDAFKNYTCPHTWWDYEWIFSNDFETKILLAHDSRRTS